MYLPSFYSEALDEKVKLLNFWNTVQGRSVAFSACETLLKSGSEKIGPEALLDRLVTALKRGSTYYVAPKICAVLAQAAASYPRDVPILYTHLPDPLQPGFCVYGSPVQLPISEEVTHLRAWTWLPIGQGTMLLSWYTLEPDLRGHRLLAFLVCEFGSTLSSCPDVIPLFKGASKDARGALLFSMSHAMTFFTFISQRLITHHRLEANRSVRRRIEREKLAIEPYINVVTLRRQETMPKFSEVERTVDWSCQWIVSGHWRAQWYPSEYIHKAKWIYPYIKGPEDKLLKKPVDTLFKVIR